MNKLLFYISIFGLSVSVLFAQTTPQETPKPLELPNFIIEGVEQINVRSGIKQNPSKTRSLNAEELDSLNSLEKESAVLLSPDPLPTNSLARAFKQGFAKASLGLFATPNLEFGYGEKIAGYELFAHAGFEASSGDVKRSNYTKFFLNGYSDFIAPEKFFIFGGSRTRTTAYIENSSYNLYAIPASLLQSGFYDRNALGYGLKIETDGNFDNVTFNTGAAFNSLQLSTNKKASDYHSSMNCFDNEFSGFLKVKSMWNNYLLAGNLILDFHSLRTNSMNFMQLDAAASYFTSDISLLVGGGFQSAVNSSGKYRGGLLLKGEIEYRMSSLMTIKGFLISGLENNSYKDFFMMNPYLAFDAPIDFMYNLALINGAIVLHPHERLTFSGGLKWRIADRMPFYDESTRGIFTLRYDQGTTLELIPEIIWDLTSKDRMTANMIYFIGALNNHSGPIPYHPLMMANFKYRKIMFDKLGTQIGLVYLSKRDVSVENTDKIDSFINLTFEADFRLNENFLLFVNFNNLTSSNIIYWNNYKERGLFANFGLMWQF